jgi:hypothetical protein
MMGVGSTSLCFGQPAACHLTGLAALGVQAVVIFFGQLAPLEAPHDVVDGCGGVFYRTMGSGNSGLGFGDDLGIAFLGWRSRPCRP